MHDEAPSASQTDWPQILALYGVLRRYLDSPVVVLDQAVAAAMVHGPLAGHAEKAVAQYQEAARLTTSEPERRYLQGRATRLTQLTGTGRPGRADRSWAARGAHLTGDVAAARLRAVQALVATRA